MKPVRWNRPGWWTGGGWFPGGDLSQKSIGMPFEPQSGPTEEPQLFAAPIFRWVVIGLLFLSALGIRLYRINEPPLEFHPTRQYRSALIARGYYVEALNSVPTWRRQVAALNREREGIWEPPVMELLASRAYRVFGGERLWIPRALSSLFWLAAGICIYFIGKKIISTDAAVFSTAFFLLLPFGVYASRTFMPDPLMVMMLLISVLAIVRYYEEPSLRRLAFSAVLSALAVFIKPFSLFPICATFVSLAICENGIGKPITRQRLLMFTVITLGPPSVFYLYGIVIRGDLWNGPMQDFLPHLLLYPFFWKGWLRQIDEVVGLTALVGGLLGILLCRRGLPKALVAGLWIGYFVFGLVFTYTIHTHDYYHLQFIPIVALSLGPIGALVMKQLTRSRSLRTTGMAILFCGVLLSMGITLYSRAMPAAFGDHSIRLSDARRGELGIAEEIGRYVGHSTATLFLAPHFGKALQYHGELSGFYWPGYADFKVEGLRGLREPSVKERFNEMLLKFSPEFFVVTELQEFEAQRDLREFLVRKFPILVQSDGYLIFDLRRELAVANRT